MTEEPSAARPTQTGYSHVVRRDFVRLVSMSGPALALSGRNAAAKRAIAAPAFPNTPGLLVAGPDGGELAGWAAAIARPLGRALPCPSLRETTIGGVDGVTGANQFDARTAPDGATVLLAPGDAALAWLVGDPRARFDIAQWVPVLAGQTPAVLAGRAALTPGQRVRIAAAGPSGPGLPALLGLDLLGVSVEPLFGLTETAALAAFARGDTEVILLGGASVPARLAALPGAQPLFTFGTPDDSGLLIRDPLFPDVPHMEELRQSPDGKLTNAWRAAASASQLAFGLFLPPLTPPAMVALWRHAGSVAVTAPETQAMAASSATRPLAAQAATERITRIASDPASLLELRRWLADNHDWRAG